MMVYIDKYPTWINVARKQTIINLAYGIRIHPKHGEINKKLITQYRNKFAENVRDSLIIDPFY